MWTIRNPKRVGLAIPKHEGSEPPNFEVPKFVARQLLQLLRVAHVACDEMDRLFPLLPADQQQLYAHLAGIDLRPSFFDVMKLIDTSEEHGLLTSDEAATLRAGRYIENPLPEDAGKGSSEAAV